MSLPRPLWTLAGVVGALLLACSPPPPSAPLAQRRPPPASALTRDWLDGGSTLRREHFERLLDVASTDPKAIAFIEQAARTLKRSGPGDLFGLMSVCAEAGEDSGGHTFFNYDIGVFSLDVESLAAGKLSPQAQAQLDQSTAAPDLMRWSRQDFADYVLVRRTVVPRICLVRGLDVLGAYETLIHELTHATARDPHFMPKKPAEVDEAAFLEAWVQAPGDEVDAYIAGTRARSVAEKGKPLARKQFQKFFDERGELLVPRLTLARAILAPAPVGLAYASTSLRNARDKALAAEQAELETRRRIVEATLKMRRDQRDVLKKNIEVFTHNTGAHRQNADMARASGDTKAQQQHLAQAAEASRSADEARRSLPVVEASIKRLEQEQASLERKR